MLPVRLIRLLTGTFVPALFAAVVSMLTVPAVFAAPLILDTQKGISDGHSGTVLQTAPLSHQRIVEAQPIASASSTTGSTQNSSTPLIVAPYIQLPSGGGTPTPHPMPQPRSMPSPK
jgi:hypothetical protein